MPHLLLSQSCEDPPYSRTTPTTGGDLILAPPSTGTGVKLFGQTLVPNPAQPAPGPCARIWTGSPIHGGVQSTYSGSGISDSVMDPVRSRRLSATGHFVTSGAQSDASMFESGLSTQEWEETASCFHGYSQAQYKEALSAEAAATTSPYPYYRPLGGGGFGQWISPSVADVWNAACMAARLGPPGEGEEAEAMAAACAQWALQRAVPSATTIEGNVFSTAKVAREEEHEEVPGALGRAARAARLKVRSAQPVV